MAKRTKKPNRQKQIDEMLAALREAQKDAITQSQQLRAYVENPWLFFRPEIPAACVSLDPDFPVPSYAHDGDFALDLYVDLSRDPGFKHDWKTGRFVLRPGRRVEIKSGWRLAIPKGYVGLIHGRSGLAFKHGVRPSYVGSIDAPYRGEISVSMEATDTAIEVAHRMKIAQIGIFPVAAARLLVATDLPPSERQDRGFGSTAPPIVVVGDTTKINLSTINTDPQEIVKTMTRLRVEHPHGFRTVDANGEPEAS